MCSMTISSPIPPAFGSLLLTQSIKLSTILRASTRTIREVLDDDFKTKVS